MFNKNYLFAITCMLFVGCSALTLKKQDKPAEFAATAPEFSAHSIPTHAKFLPPTEGNASRTIASTLTGQCVITNNVCAPYNNAFTGTFVDFTTTVYVPQLASFCASRAQDYFNTCQEAPGSVVTATYYQTGQTPIVTTYPVPTPTPTPGPNVTQFAYVGAGGSGGNDQVYQCTVNASTGALSGCAVSPGAPANNSVATPWIGGAFTSGSNSFVYYNSPTGLNVCGVAVNGALTCQASGASGSQGMGFLSTANGNYAYTSIEDVGVTGCSLNTSNGQLTNCSSVISSYSGQYTPDGVQFFTTTTGTTYGYVSNWQSGVSACAVSASGVWNCSSSPNNLGGSVITPTGAYSVHTYGFTLQKAGANTFAYITETYALNNVTYGALVSCLVDPPTGNFTNCAVTGNVSSWSPFQVALGTVSGQTYAYVADTGGSNYTASGNVYQCSVNTTSGALSSCVKSNGGISAWSPNSIVILNAP